MKYVRQFTIILVVSFIGELLNYLIPLPVPASIYGLVIMLICLLTGVIPLHAVRDTGRFLVEVMPLMFIPGAVGLLESWGVLRPIWAPVLAITVVTTVAVMAATGRITQGIVRMGQKKEGGEAANE
ncbi:MAG: CidA/LrgA family protein [Emergencia timonensis]|uniref:CidA/LrgA family protein n=1 Tax=Emergencia timonensis TaxID=1776384 RepID=UPI0008378736|nr:CidA/LrgA family protein [Emergencia timonensis]WNX90044.1 CidA/LrgA family protein [Emergencia timonensis]